MYGTIYESVDGEIVSYDNIFSRLLQDRILFIANEITSDLASSLCATLYYLNTKSKDPIIIYINSSGGDITSLFSIYDMINIIESPVSTVCMGEASSAAAFILAAGTKGLRFAFPNSEIMIHQVQISGLEGSGTDVDKQAKSIKKLKNRLTEILARHTGQLYNKVLKDCEVDKFMSSEEALKYGIIDEVITHNKSIPELVRSKSKIIK